MRILTAILVGLCLMTVGCGKQDTYAWLYSFQLLNEKGKRMGRLQ